VRKHVLQRQPVVIADHAYRQRSFVDQAHQVGARDIQQLRGLPRGEVIPIVSTSVSVQSLGTPSLDGAISPAS
jgi:hypothetical protein